MALLPVPATLLLGGLIGVVGEGPIRRWVATLRSTRSGAPTRPGAPRDDAGLMTMFVALHPAPWALLLGLPFLAYQLTLGPMPMLWALLALGMACGAVLSRVAAARVAKSRRWTRDGGVPG